MQIIAVQDHQADDIRPASFRTAEPVDPQVQEQQHDRQHPEQYLGKFFRGKLKWPYVMARTRHFIHSHISPIYDFEPVKYSRKAILSTFQLKTSPAWLLRLQGKPIFSIIFPV